MILRVPLGDSPFLRSVSAPPAAHRVSVLVHEGMAPFELGIVTEVFGLARPELDVAWWYELSVVAERAGTPLGSIGGLRLSADFGLERLAASRTVIVPAWPTEREASAELLAAVRAAHAGGARLISICSGAFLLAQTGVLDGRTVATHWRYADTLAQRFRRLRVDSDVLYVDGGDVITSAGSAAGIDACLHVIRVDHGSAVANIVARRLVIAPHRDGGQAQIVERPVGSADADDLLRQVMDWALEHLAEPIRVEDLARRAFMSPRTFTRRFAQATGTSPLRWLIEQRVAASLALLESTVHPVDHVGGLVGFSHTATYRHHFARIMGTSPSGYRRAFRERQQSA